MGPQRGRGVIGRLRDWARALRREVTVLWLAARDPATPWPARALAVAIVAYALSPIDLIPDAIPVLGLLDEAILLPLLILLVRRLIPPGRLRAYREEAERLGRLPPSRAGAAVVVLLWLLGAVFLAAWLGVLREGP